MIKKPVIYTKLALIEKLKKRVVEMKNGKIVTDNGSKKENRKEDKKKE